jgi:pimeloyl-ACP methyl ester carboxylesterase
MIPAEAVERLVHIPAGVARVEGELRVPAGARGIVAFAHGSGSSRFSPRNNFVADVLRRSGLGTLMMDLLTRHEDENYQARFDVDLLTRRLVMATWWLRDQPAARDLAVGYFGASTGAAAALFAAAELGREIGAVVSRGGRPDLAGPALARVQSPTLLIVGGEDDVVVALNRQAYRQIKAEKQIAVIPGAGHLFEEPGALDEVAQLAADWFTRHLAGGAE